MKSMKSKAAKKKPAKANEVKPDVAIDANELTLCQISNIFKMQNDWLMVFQPFQGYL